MLSLSLVRPKASTLLACTVVLAALAPATLHATLAGTAGVLFEIAPFVLGVALLQAAITSRRLAALGSRWPAPLTGKWASAVVALAGCGCVAGPFGGALSPAAAGLCWVAFGPLVAIARLVVALGLAAWTWRTRDPEHLPTPDPLRDLNAALPGAAAGTLVAALLAAHPAGFGAWPLAGGLGLLAGWLMPCTSGAIALAAALRHVLPAASAGILLSAGLMPRQRLDALRLGDGKAAAHVRCATESDQRSGCGGSAGSGPSTSHLALGGVGLACAWLVARGGAGFVHPRLVPLVAAGCVLALARLPFARRIRSASAALTVPAILLAALVFGSPIPSTFADATTLDGAYAGERVIFIGTAMRRNGATVLVRYAITCCRADAMPVALRLDRGLDVANGRWVRADGRLRTTASGLVLQAAATQEIAAPRDPFVYR